MVESTPSRRGFAEKIKGTLPEPEAITTARRNIHLPEFRAYLEDALPNMNASKTNDFINFLDTFLQDFGKGMAFVNWEYGAISPALSIGDIPASIIADEEQHRIQQFPKQSTVRIKIGPSIRAESKNCKLFSLSEQRSSDGLEIMLSLAELRKLHAQSKDSEAASVPLTISAIGTFEPLTHSELYLAAGAHETFHLYDMHAHPKRYDQDYKNYPTDISTQWEEYNSNPIEVRAQNAAKAALEYYRAKSVDSSRSIP